MSKAKFSKAEVAKALMQVVPELADTKALETAKSRIVEVEKGHFHEYNEALRKSAKKYAETELTQADLDKIEKIKEEIDTFEAEIAKVGDQTLKSQQNALAAALKKGDFAKVSQLTADVAQKQAQNTEKQREEIRIRQKQINSLNNKKDLAALGVFCTEMGISTTESGEPASTAQYSFAGQRFYVEAPRKSLGYSADFVCDVDTRRIWVKPVGKDWDQQMRSFMPWFAGFWVEPTGDAKKHAISSRKRLCLYASEWIKVATQEKPSSDMDLLEVTNKVNKRLELGNLDPKYAGGSEYAYRLVEELQKDEKDVGHQRLYSQYPDPGWDSLEEHEAVVNALIDAEMEESDEKAEEAAKSEAKAA